VEQTVASGPSDRVRLAQIARETALAVPGVVDLDSGPAGLCVTVGGGVRVAGVSSAAALEGGFDVSLRLVCELVALRPLADRVRAAIRTAATDAGLATQTVTILVAAISDPVSG
jgi:hypothetical protein